ncbi:hypothetical protein C8R45DRAFT_930256 [Mycena sanguinolenta]|nr:hypothetical protein C8R45DRAFT_930256 [Mycena sanguinolenta]
MSSLLDLSPELVAAIVDHLAPNTDDLRSLCLTGNHNLLALVRPYTWRQLTLTLDADLAKSQSLSGKLRAFLADPFKARSVRSLCITLIGSYDITAPASRALLDALPLLTHTTHASLDCTNAPPAASGPTHALLIKRVVQTLPALLSLRVTCATDPWGETLAADMPASAPLRHIATRFCNPAGVAQLWTYCPNLNVIEMEGGPAEAFYREHTVDASAPYQGHTSYSTGVDFLFTPPAPQTPDDADEEAPPRPALLDTATSISLRSDAQYDDSDACALMHYFTVGSPSPSPTLRQWSSSLTLSVDHFAAILRGVRSPTIQRVSITLPGSTLSDDFASEPESAEDDEALSPASSSSDASDAHFFPFSPLYSPFTSSAFFASPTSEYWHDASHFSDDSENEDEHWRPSEFDSYLLKLSRKDEGRFFAGFESLTDLVLPCDGVSARALTLLPTLLAHAPALQHLWFATPSASSLASLSTSASSTSSTPSSPATSATLAALGLPPRQENRHGTTGAERRSGKPGPRNRSAALATPALAYAAAIPTLRSVSWRGVGTFRVVRDEAGCVCVCVASQSDCVRSGSGDDSILPNTHDDAEDWDSDSGYGSGYGGGGGSRRGSSSSSSSADSFSFGGWQGKQSRGGRNNGSVKCVRERYRAPAWERWDGVGGWWEM